jgi:hypothetical protein
MISCFSFYVAVILTLLFIYLYIQQQQVLLYRHYVLLYVCCIATTGTYCDSSTAPFFVVGAKLQQHQGQSSRNSKQHRSVCLLSYCKHQEVPLVTAAESPSDDWRLLLRHNHQEPSCTSIMLASSPLNTSNGCTSFATSSEAVSYICLLSFGRRRIGHSTVVPLLQAPGVKQQLHHL